VTDNNKLSRGETICHPPMAIRRDISMAQPPGNASGAASWTLPFQSLSLASATPRRTPRRASAQQET